MFCHYIDVMYIEVVYIAVIYNVLVTLSSVTLSLVKMSSVKMSTTSVKDAQVLTYNLTTKFLVTINRDQALIFDIPLPWNPSSSPPPPPPPPYSQYVNHTIKMWILFISIRFKNKKVAMINII